jgi:hypothetical protein
MIQNLDWSLLMSKSLGCINTGSPMNGESPRTTAHESKSRSGQTAPASWALPLARLTGAVVPVNMAFVFALLAQLGERSESEL